MAFDSNDDRRVHSADTENAGSDADGTGGVSENTRRSFLAGSAGALGGLAIAGMGGVAADEHQGNQTDGENATIEQATDLPDENPFEDDVEILNYALTLERLEAAFYEQALENIDEDELFQIDGLSDVSDDRQEMAWEELQTIQEHEQAHADALATTIEDIDGEPVTEPELDFGSAVEDPQEFLTTAVLLEDTGVGAYAGAAPFIEDDDLVPPALSIHSVEGRHAAFVRALDGETAFPDTFDEALSRDVVLERAASFITQPPEELQDAVDEATDDASDDDGDDDSDDNGDDDSDDDGDDDGDDDASDDGDDDSDDDGDDDSDDNGDDDSDDNGDDDN